MATPVPYQGVPERVPSLEPTPSLNVGANPNAFGINVAEAASHLGQVVENSGKELFDRAYAMQDLQVHADVNARLADMANKSMNLEADYSNLEGKAAVDGLPGFIGSLDKARQDAGNGLSPIGQSYYDTESRNWRNRIAWSGVDHAKQEQKRYVVGSAQASMETEMKGMELNPDDAAANAQAIQKIKDLADLASTTHGVPLDSPMAVKARNDAVNKAVIGQIRGLAEKGDFIGAQKLFNDANSKKEIYGEDSARMGEYIKWQRDLHGSRVSAGQVLNHGAGMNLDGNVQLSDQRILAGLKGSEGGSYSYIGPTITDKSGNTGHVVGHWGVMSYNLQGWLRESGIGPMSEEEFLHDPQAQDALALWKFKQYQQKYGTKGAAKAWFGGEGSLDIPDDKLHDKNMSFTQYWGNFSGGVARGSSLEDIASASRNYAYSQFPGDDDFADATEQRAIALHNQEVQIRRDTDFNNDQAISNALFAGVGPQKKLPTSPEELQLDPQAKAAWDQMQATHPSMMGKYLNIMAHNAKGDVAMTPERLQHWQTLSGEAVQDPDRFMADTKDLSQLDLPRAQVMEIIRMQSAIYKKADVSPQMGHALGIVGPMLDALGVTKADNPDKRNLFTGILHDAMQQYQQDNKKPMPDDEIRATAQRLLNPVTGSGFFSHMFGRSTPWFESIDAVPEDAAAAIRQDYESRGIQPNDASILRDYLAAQYRELYGKKPSAKPPSGGK